MKYKTVKLTEILIPKRGNSVYTKAYGVKNPGKYPVYSAAIEPLTYIDHFDYNGEYLTWNTNGFGGYVTVLSGKFSINGDRGILIPKREDINIHYIAETIQGDLRQLAKGRLGDKGKNEFTKVSLDTIKRKAFVTMPLAKDEDKYDVKIQEAIAKDFRKVSDVKKYIETQTKELGDAKFDIPVEGLSITLNVEDIFDLGQSTNNSSLTKKFVNQHQGDIPVYSASSDESLVGYGFIADNLPGVKYFQDILTWNIDGSVGRAIFRSGRFSLSEKVIPLILKPKWKDKINLDFIRFILEEKAAERGFGYSNKAGKSRIADIELEIPAKKKDSQLEPDIELQAEIATRYQQAYARKDNLIQELDRLLQLEVSLTGSNKTR